MKLKKNFSILHKKNRPFCVILMMLTTVCAWAQSEPSVQLANSTISGTCGDYGNEDKVTWAVTDTNDDGSYETLTISGTGAMKNYNTNQPWAAFKDVITTANIGDGVTRIGGNAFYQFTALTSVTIASSVTTIGNAAFFECTNLATINGASGVTKVESSALNETAWYNALPNGLTCVGHVAYLFVGDDTSVTLDAATTQIYDNCFQGSQLTSIIIPASVKSIGDNAFASSALQKMYVLRHESSYPEITQLGEDAFLECSNDLAIVVPADAYSNYSGHWHSYSSKLKRGYTVTCGTGITATTTNNGPLVEQGETVTLAASGYAINSASYNDGTDHTITAVNAVWSFTMPASDVTVTANLTTIPWTGTGTAKDPYVIQYASQLDLLATGVNNGTSYSGKYFVLANDITYTHTTDWDDATSTENNYTAIGTYDHPFKGTFDGKNYTISGIRIYKNDDTDDEYQGLFGYVGEGGTVKNVILSDARITGHGPVGGIAGSNDGTIENCLVTASVSTTALDGDVGGIVGFNFATVKGNMVIGAIVTSGNNEAGGIAAYSSCLGVNGENPGSVTGNLVIGATVSGASFGAIVSNNEYSNLSSNYYNGCTVGETVNATGVGVFCFDFSTGSKDITTNEGAVAGYFLTLGEGITAATAKAVVTVPEHKDLDDAGELVTVDEKTYNIFTIDQEVTLSASEEGYLLTNCTVTKDDDDSDVTYDVLSGTTLTMPDYNITVTGTTEICTPSDIEITSANFTDYFYYDADFEYSNSTPTTGLAGEGTDYDKNKKGGYFLKATVAAESNLDFKGDFIPDATGNFNPRIIINKRVNITSSDKSAVFMPYISNDETVKLYWNFGIIAGADYTEVENLQFENCWVFNYGSSYVTFDGIDMKVEDVRIGSGVGGLSILTTEEGAHAADHATVKNSTFYFKSNGGTAGIIAGCGAPYATFDNNTITGEGNVGNMLYASPFNSKGDYPEFATFTNNVITKTDAATAICYGLVSCGQGNLIENNTVNYAGSAITTAWGGSTLSETSAKNTYRNNTTTLGGSMTVHNYSDIENNQVSGLLTVAQGATATGNTAAEMTVSGQDATIKNNTVNGDVTISKTIASFTDNAIYGTLTVSSTNNTITGNVILSSGQNAIVLNSSDNTVSGNILISADHEGDAAVETSMTNTIANNTLAAYESATATSQSNTPYMITSETTTLSAGDNAGTFYYVPTNATVTINGELAITPIEGTTSPKVNLLLGDGAKLRVENISGSDCSLTIYGQSLDYNIGQLSVVGSDKAIDVCNYTQNGGYVKAEGDNYGLYATGNVTLNGGTFSAYSYSLDTDRPGIYCGAGKKIILGGGYVDSNFLSGGDDFAIEIPDGAFYIDGYANIYDNSYPDDLLDAWADPDETFGFLLLFPGKDVKGVTLTKDSNDDWTATFDGNSLEESYSIPYSCSVEEVHFNRTFTEGKKTCICWPFSVSKTEAAALGTFYEFSAVTAEGKIQMTEVTNGLDYNKPYIFEPKADITSIELDSRRLNFTYNPKVTNGDLTFKGIYDRVKWTKDTTDPLYDADRAAELGKAYGFALEELAGYSVGQFAKLGSGAHSRPFRAYLINEGDWNGEEPGTAARGTSAKTLPDVIEIEWISAKGETTGISTLDTRTGEITDGVWFTLDGRRLEGKPAKKGLYINNGKKVLVP